MTLFDVLVSALHATAEIISLLMYVHVWAYSADGSRARFQTISAPGFLFKLFIKAEVLFAHWRGIIGPTHHQRLIKDYRATRLVPVYVLFVFVAAVQSNSSPQGSLKFHCVLAFYRPVFQNHRV